MRKQPCTYPIKSARGLPSPQEGLALVITLIALALFSLLGFYVAFRSTTEVRISDNYESAVQARFAALAGVDHARELLRGLNLDDQLKGPDGIYDSSPAYLSQARTFSFRNPIPWSTARSLNILDPAADLAGIPDDGLLNTGKTASGNGTVLIPLTGIAQTVPDPYGPGIITISRYFVKVSDNNRDALEIAQDPADNPFHDGDRVVIVRSLGVARTIRENTSGRDRWNSMAVFEAQLKRRGTFKLQAAFVVQGIDVQPCASTMFDGTSFQVRGDAGIAGIATIDADPGDLVSPADQISASVAPDQQGNISGMGLTPSIRDITAPVSADADTSLLLRKDFLSNFAGSDVPGFADNSFQGNQSWAAGSTPDLGNYDPALPSNDPAQRPKVTLVNGDLSIGDGVAGGGLLIVTGRLTVNGRFAFNGLVLVVGKGEMEAYGMNPGVRGGVYLASLLGSSGQSSWGTVEADPQPGQRDHHRWPFCRDGDQPDSSRAAEHARDYGSAGSVVASSSCFNEDTDLRGSTPIRTSVYIGVNPCGSVSPLGDNGELRRTRV